MQCVVNLPCIIEISYHIVTQKSNSKVNGACRVVKHLLHIGEKRREELILNSCPAALFEPRLARFYSLKSRLTKFNGRSLIKLSAVRLKISLIRPPGFALLHKAKLANPRACARWVRSLSGQQNEKDGYDPLFVSSGPRLVSFEVVDALGACIWVLCVVYSFVQCRQVSPYYIRRNLRTRTLHAGSRHLLGDGTAASVF